MQGRHERESHVDLSISLTAGCKVNDRVQKLTEKRVGV